MTSGHRGCNREDFVDFACNPGIEGCTNDFFGRDGKLFYSSTVMKGT